MGFYRLLTAQFKAQNPPGADPGPKAILKNLQSRSNQPILGGGLTGSEA
jgi:hypothetical protein